MYMYMYNYYIYIYCIYIYMYTHYYCAHSLTGRGPDVCAVLRRHH